MKKNYVASVFKGSAYINFIIGMIVAIYFGIKTESAWISLGILLGVFEVCFLQYAMGEVFDLLASSEYHQRMIYELLSNKVLSDDQKFSDIKGILVKNTGMNFVKESAISNNSSTQKPIIDNDLPSL